METVVLSFSGNVAVLELNRPDSLNAMDVQMLNELVEALRQVERSDAQLLLIRGRGRGFSAGGDIKTMLRVEDEEAFHDVMNTIQQLITTLYELPKIVVAAIHGPAAGLGLSFALASDYVIATKDARLAMNFIGIGLVPDGGGHFFLAKRVGEVKAKHLIWEGKTMSAMEAYDLGIVDFIVENEEQIKQKLAEWQAKPLQAMIATKTLYAKTTKDELLHVLQLETDAQQKMRKTKDHREGVQAFLEKRKPNFIGK
ncbi:enoyl-CoA hydratase/carnithine racemase [Anoxybacillus voinovskiensis]|uniref:Enoyl-CoA hydratase/carnithine racemase n=1 Tax=Anoxybacteroides voinovskiense TaxID=230470 RepID=A0A840DG97_9BACL|nr:enoyl-CoA hydratase [Anoxybacillus voinovskiensis]MBB4072421.1 enoyl-CoA hydratase/carnithine racemase [Anoxybacillus voinovskiensis]GGJ58047.1 enoyl-CoA hydratase [Anoxybacillus voinovskiensis]